MVRVRLKIIRNELIKNVGKFQSCMVSKLRIIFKRIVQSGEIRGTIGMLVWRPDSKRFVPS